MSQTSPRLNLPFIQPAQAQKHVTHNEAIRVLDGIVQLVIEAFDAETPPTTPNDGDTYALGSTPTGAWAGHSADLAIWLDAGWTFVTPSAGWRAVEAGTTTLSIHDGSGWVAASEPDLNNLSGVGINAASDTNNRLAVSAPATLLTHEGAGHQIKVNKAGLSDTASLLFQTNWSGRAEMGLAGNDDFSIKVSADGSTWTEVMRVGASDGVITTDNMVGTVSATPSAGSAVIETGTGANGTFTKFADGTLICQLDSFSTASGAAATWTLPETFATAAFTVSVTVKGSTPAFATISSQSTTSVDIESFDMLGLATATPDVSLLAVGRWM